MPVAVSIPILKTGDRVRLKYDGSFARVVQIKRDGAVIVETDNGVRGSTTRYGVEKERCTRRGDGYCSHEFACND